jgi:probable F420-dependent oxidoreductase
VEADRLRVGVNILNFGPGAKPETLLRWAQVSEALGYHSVMISDHVAITPSVRQRYPEPYWDTFATLAWLAGQTKRVQLGTTVLVLPYRHPVLTARLAANVDQFSDGRFIFGVGIGNAEDEFRALNQPHARRGRLGDECLAAILALWQGDGSVSFNGRIIKFDDVSAIGTVQKPHPPVWVGGASDAALQRAVRFGDAWHPIIRSMATVKETALPTMAKIAASEGRAVPRFCPRIRLDLREPVEGERMPGVGSLEQVHADLRQLEEMGAEHVILDWFTGDLEATRDHNHGWRMLAVLAEEALDLDGERVR